MWHYEGFVRYTMFSVALGYVQKGKKERKTERPRQRQRKQRDSKESTAAEDETNKTKGQQGERPRTEATVDNTSKDQATGKTFIRQRTSTTFQLQSLNFLRIAAQKSPTLLFSTFSDVSEGIS